MATTSAPELGLVNPATLEPVGSVARADPDDVAAAVAAAADAQRRWREIGAAARAQVLREAGRVVRMHADEIAACVCSETAKPRTEAIAHDLYPAVDHAAWLARNATRVLADERVSFTQLHLKTKKAWLVYEPFGVVSRRSRRGTSRSEFRLLKWQQQWPRGRVAPSLSQLTQRR